MPRPRPRTALDLIIDRLINGQPAQVYIMTEYEDPDRDADLETCVDCNGHGVDPDDEPCEWCMGTGVIRPGHTDDRPTVG